MLRRDFSLWALAAAFAAAFAARRRANAAGSPAVRTASDVADWPPIADAHLYLIKRYNDRYGDGTGRLEIYTADHVLLAIQDGVTVDIPRNGRIAVSTPGWVVIRESGIPAYGLFTDQKGIPYMRLAIGDGCGFSIDGPMEKGGKFTFGSGSIVCGEQYTGATRRGRKAAQILATTHSPYKRPGPSEKRL